MPSFVFISHFLYELLVRDDKLLHSLWSRLYNMDCFVPWILEQNLISRHVNVALLYIFLITHPCTSLYNYCMSWIDLIIIFILFWRTYETCTLVGTMYTSLCDFTSLYFVHIFAIIELRCFRVFEALLRSKHFRLATSIDDEKCERDPWRGIFMRLSDDGRCSKVLF